MARPLWRDLRTAREQRSFAPLATATAVPPPPKARWLLALVSTAAAIGAIALERIEHGSLARGASLHAEAWAWSASAAFLVFGSIAIRRVATQLGRIVHLGAGAAAGSALRLTSTIIGLIIVVLVTIAMLGVSASRIIAAAGITGVIIGLAAQQSLGNVFAGIVLMIARPFVVGQRIRVRSGSFGGIFDGEVRAMGLTYVEFMTDDGFLRVPNLGMLAAAVGPAPPKEDVPDARKLYVGRSVQKRPPRAVAEKGRRPPQKKAPAQRIPREIIRRMRERRESPGEDPPAPPRR